MTWQPISTAPKDGTIVDLYCVGERWTDCYWGFPHHCCGEYEGHCDSDWHGLEEGWVHSATNEVLTSIHEGDHLDPTHWMPLPPPPTEENK
jgi:hypothetical protein